MLYKLKKWYCADIIYYYKGVNIMYIILLYYFNVLKHHSCLFTSYTKIQLNNNILMVFFFLIFEYV